MISVCQLTRDHLASYLGVAFPHNVALSGTHVLVIAGEGANVLIYAAFRTRVAAIDLILSRARPVLRQILWVRILQSDALGEAADHWQSPRVVSFSFLCPIAS